jgi:hypothetical protein
VPPVRLGRSAEPHPPDFAGRGVGYVRYRGYFVDFSFSHV